MVAGYGSTQHLLENLALLSACPRPVMSRLDRARPGIAASGPAEGWAGRRMCGILCVRG